MGGGGGGAIWWKVMESNLAILNLLVAISVNSAAHVQGVVKGNLKMIKIVIIISDY